MDAAPELFLVYGNHGASPVQIEDYIDYLCAAMQHAGITPRLTEFPVPGAANILIECFAPEFVETILAAARVPGTVLSCIVTEFLTGRTFNSFSSQEGRLDCAPSSATPSAGARHGTLAARFDRFASGHPQSVWLERFERVAARLRKTFWRLDGSPHYSRLYYWRNRFAQFSRVAEVCAHIVCVSPHQVDAYTNRFGDKVLLLPIVSHPGRPPSFPCAALAKDIDFLFTGTLTPYRQTRLAALTQRGFQVVCGPAIWPSAVRTHFMARAKICIHMKQEPSWKYPSIMRYHHLISQGAVVVGEKTHFSCVQERFAHAVPPEHFIDECISQLRQGEFTARGLRMRDAYADASLSEHATHARLVRKLLPRTK